MCERKREHNEDRKRSREDRREELIYPDLCTIEVGFNERFVHGMDGIGDLLDSLLRTLASPLDVTEDALDQIEMYSS